MKPTLWIVIGTMALGANSTYADSANDILEAAWDAQIERWDGLDSYLVEQTVMGQTSKQYFVRTTVTDSNGTARTMFLEASDAGLEPGCVNMAATTLEAAGSGDTSAEYLAWFMDSAELVGEGSIDGKAAWQLRADDVEHTTKMSDDDITISSMTMWLGKDEYLPLGMSMEGEAAANGQAQSVTIDMTASDFRPVSGSQLVEPYLRTVSVSGLGGMIDDAQMAEARKAMAELEKQLESMPEAQREMMKSMMGPQLEQMENMANSGSIEMDIEVQSVTPNPDVNGERVVACGGN